MNRREFSQWVGRGLTAIGLGSLVAEAPAPAPAVADHRRAMLIKDAADLQTRTHPVHRPVHWVSLDRRHIEAVLIGENPGGAILEVEMRPPVVLGGGRVVRSTQRITNVPHHEPTSDGDHWQANSWHEIEFQELRPAKPYAEWWYKRPPEDSEAVTPRPERWNIVEQGGVVPVLLVRVRDGLVIDSRRADDLQNESYVRRYR